MSHEQRFWQLVKTFGLRAAILLAVSALMVYSHNYRELYSVGSGDWVELRRLSLPTGQVVWMDPKSMTQPQLAMDAMLINGEGAASDAVKKVYVPVTEPRTLRDATPFDEPEWRLIRSAVKGLPVPLILITIISLSGLPQRAFEKLLKRIGA